ncbi:MULTISPECIES: glycosyltransferase family 4 protein [Collinsella]|uniref:glycosyltransferase family 4 protein n=1 Tax=Collinsella TaxID=102106 RepID=UPI000B7CB5A5|nr:MULTISPECIES: glycosyltransferase family 4 protein [Collinsella]MBX9026339.1 glycosyltransferase family 4 protein [Collinsella aerofaciens]RGL43565.1 glycosyltransferase family 1 protein [Collinsella sp. TF06-6AC]
MVSSKNIVHAKVLMVGPDLSLHGGIVSVVQGYLDGGLPEACDGFDYLGTGVGCSKLAKSFAFARALARYAMAMPSYDIVHLHISARGSYRRKSIMARMAHKAGKRVILHDHDGEFKKAFEESDDAYRRDVRETFGIADRVVVLSEEWRDYFAENVCDSGKIDVVHNGVKVTAKPCSPCSRHDVLFLGRLDARKSPDVLLRASRDVLSCFPDTKIVFGGDGEVEKNKQLAAELDIADRCEFLGWVTGDEREALFERAAVYCLPSKNEGMPMSVLEAMARGIPTIATSVGGIPQVIRDGVNGYLMPVDDESKLSGLLCTLMGSEDLRLSIGRAGRSTISGRFNVKRNVDAIVQLYKELVD